MIKIDTIKIEKWEEIKENHSKWCRVNIKEKIIFLNSFLDESYKKEKTFYKLIESKLDEIILSDKLSEIIKFFNEKYTEIKKESNNIDVEFCNEGIAILKNKDKIKKDTIESIINNYIDKHKSNSFINELEEKLLKIKKDNNNSETIRKEVKKELENIKNYLPDFETRVNHIFNYKKFQTEKRHEILSLMGIEVCPYCQRNYITNYNDEDNKELTTADLDHFYPQAQYPYLALSLYNFIPSCHTCNSTMKGGEPTGIDTHIYPYTDSMEEDIKFSVETDSFIDNVFTENQNLNIDINVNIVSKEGKEDIKRPEKIEKSIETFKLREVYKNSHSKYVGDLIHNFQKYPKSYTKALGEIFLEDKDKDSKEHQEKLQILNDNFQEIIKKPYTDKIEKGEPLAKLTKDIMEELGIK